MNKKLIIFGEGDIAQIAHDYFERDTNYTTEVFVLDSAYRKQDTFEGKPLLDFETIQDNYPPNEYDMFIALSYTDMNRLREKKYHEAKKKGYNLASYVSPKCNYLSKYRCGENCFIFEDNTIQPYVKIGDNVVLWSGNHIGHHSTIESHNFISSHVVISGHCHIKPNSFLGVNCTIAHQVTIESLNIIGAGAVIAKSTERNSIYVPTRSTRLDKKSDEVKL